MVLKMSTYVGMRNTLKIDPNPTTKLKYMAMSLKVIKGEVKKLKGK